MDYPTARHLIQDGDLLLEKSRKGPLPWATRLVTQSDYTHSLVAVWMNGRIWGIEINGTGSHAVPLSQIKQPFDVFRPVLCAEKLAGLLDSLNERTSYSIPDLVVIGMRDLFSLRIPYSDGGLVCSGFSAQVLCSVGWNPIGLPEIPSPSDLAKQFDKPVLEVTP